MEYFSNHTFPDLISAVVLIAAVFACIEKLFRQIWRLFIKAYNRMKGKEEEASIIDKNTIAIQALAKNIENLGNLVDKQYTQLEEKIDEQKKCLTALDLEGKQRDCALLRDRLLGGIRYYSQRKDEYGIVHISLTDHENMSHLFQEYFSCNGNGTIKTIYDNEFNSWMIDR